MNSASLRWPVAGLVAGALCLTLSAAPAPAHPHEDDDADGEVRKEIRINRNDDGEEAQIRGGYLGVRVQDISRELQRARDLPSDDGALVNRVEPGSPAAEEGIRRGDVIIRVNGEEIDDAAELVREMREIAPGSKANIVVLRDRSRKTFDVTLGERPRESFGDAPRFNRRWMDAFEGLPMEERIERLDRMERELQRLQEEIRSLREELREQSKERSD